MSIFGQKIVRIINRTYLKTTPPAIRALCRKDKAQGRRRTGKYGDSRSNAGIAAKSLIPPGCGPFRGSLRCSSVNGALLRLPRRALRSAEMPRNAGWSIFEIGSNVLP
jgi:hypothetical protein